MLFIYSLFYLAVTAITAWYGRRYYNRVLAGAFLAGSVIGYFALNLNTLLGGFQDYFWGAVLVITILLFLLSRVFTYLIALLVIWLLLAFKVFVPIGLIGSVPAWICLGLSIGIIFVIRKQIIPIGVSILTANNLVYAILCLGMLIDPVTFGFNLLFDGGVLGNIILWGSLIASFVFQYVFYPKLIANSSSSTSNTEVTSNEE